MGLQELVGISLDAVPVSEVLIRRLLAGASRHIADSKVGLISAETRFASAYTAIRMLADAGLAAHGYRTPTSKPGHHRTALQTLGLTLGVDATTMRRLDALRHQRNVAEYSGDVLPESAVSECIAQAEHLNSTTIAWMRKNHPEWLA